MTHAHPYHTTTGEHGSHHEVYHDHTGCPDGERIKPEHRVAGTGGRRRCEKCAEMQ